MPTRLKVDVDPPIARVTLTSRDGENRIGADTIEDLRGACTTLADQPEVRVLIVGGGGGAFALGWDADLLDTAGAPGETALLPGDPFGCLAELPLPVIAAIDGDAFSAGLELALACDLRVAAGGARFGFPETEFGLIPLAGGTQRLPRVVGRARALAMLLLGQMVDAATAADWGLVNLVARSGSAMEAARDLAAVIARRGPIAERFAKEAVLQGIDMPLARALRYELDLTVLLQTTDDRAEGVRAFAEKREPRFSGR